MNVVRSCCMITLNMFIENCIERNMNLGLLTASNSSSFFTSALIVVHKKVFVQGVQTRKGENPLLALFADFIQNLDLTRFNNQLQLPSAPWNLYANIGRELSTFYSTFYLSPITYFKSLILEDNRLQAIEDLYKRSHDDVELFINLNNLIPDGKLFLTFYHDY